MGPEGWYPDPYGNHDQRWFANGRPTNLVCDQGVQSFDGPLREPSEPWRWWTVCLPAVLALVVAGLFVVYSGLAAGLGCMDGCPPVSAGRPVGTTGDVVVAVAAVVLLVVGLAHPDWRRACAAGLWIAFALGCVCAVMITTAHYEFAPGPSVAPVPGVIGPTDNLAECKAIGGRVLTGDAVCFGVPYIGDNGERDFGAVWYGADGQLAGPADTVGTGATQAECESGRYPDGPKGPVTRPPGQWNAQLSYCMP
jgi:hypothetical protein